MDKQVLKERIKEVSDFLQERLSGPLGNAESIERIINEIKDIAKLKESNEMSLRIGMMINYIIDAKEKQYAYSQWMKNAKNLCVDLNRDIDKVREFTTEAEKNNIGIALIEILNQIRLLRITPEEINAAISNAGYSIGIYDENEQLITCIGDGNKTIKVISKPTETIKATIIKNGI